MSWNKVDPENLADYVEKFGAKADELWWFVHVPKTSGTSVGKQLLSMRRPSHNVFIPASKLQLQNGDAWDEPVTAFIAANAARPIRFGTSHLSMVKLEAIRAVRPDMRMFTFMRDPVDRVISEYRYRVTEKHPPYRAFRKAYPTIHDYVEHRSSQNTMFKRMLPSQQMTNPDAAEWIDDNFAFVGIHERYQKSLAMLGRLLKIKLDPEVRMNPTETTEENTFELTDELREKIDSLNRRDRYIYRHFLRKLNAVKLASLARRPLASAGG